jgi:hypothetical protein
MKEVDPEYANDQDNAQPTAIQEIETVIYFVLIHLKIW